MYTLEQITNAYTKILESLDKATQEVYANTKLPCRKNCALCCIQLFPVSFIEGYSISMQYRKLDRSTRRKLKKNAERVEKKLRQNDWSSFSIFNAEKKIFYEKKNCLAETINQIKIACPLLDESMNCSVYGLRPHDCRVHGCSKDKKSMEVLGCEKFTFDVISQPLLHEKLLDQNHLYPEVLKLSELLIQSITKGEIPEKTSYFSSMSKPILLDFTERDWLNFLKEKFSSQTPKKDSYHLIVEIV